MRRILFAAIALSLSVLPAWAQNTTGLVVATCGTVVTAFKAGNPGPFTVDVNGNLCQTGGGGGGGSVTQGTTPWVDNITQWANITLGAATAWGTPPTGNVPGVNANILGPLGQQLSAASIPVVLPAAQITTLTPPTTVTANQGTPGASPWPISLPTTPTIAAGNGEVPTASSESAAGLTPVPSTALEANHVIKGSAGNLYSFNVSADATLSGAAWWLMIYNATSAPADGAVTPAKCYAFPSGTTGYSAAFTLPVNFSTGITMGVSTTGCFTKTASAHAFISGDAK